MSNVETRPAMIEILGAFEIFSCLAPAELAMLAGCATSKRWAAGTIIAAQNEPPKALSFVQRGLARLTLVGENGREITLSMLRAGDLFGVSSVLDIQPRAATVMASEVTQVVAIPAAVVSRLVRRDPTMALKLSCIMLQRLGEADRLIADLALCDVNTRLIRTLRELAEEVGEQHQDGIMLRRRPTQQDLANMVGSCRETISRALSSMARDGLLVSRGRMLLLRHALLSGDRKSRKQRGFAASPAAAPLTAA